MSEGARPKGSADAGPFFAMPCVVGALQEVWAMSGDGGLIPPISTTWSRLSRGAQSAERLGDKR